MVSLKNCGKIFLALMILQILFNFTKLNNSDSIVHGESDLDEFIIQVENEVVIGGSKSYIPSSAFYSDNGEYVLSGARGQTGWYDNFLIKLDTNYNVVLNKTYVWDGYDDSYKVIPTYDGNYVLVGKTVQLGGKGTDVLLMKLNQYGDIVWKKLYWQGNGWDWGQDVVQTSENDLLVVGCTQDYGLAYYDFYIIKTNLNGELIWSKVYKFRGNNYANSVLETSDGGYIIVGTTVDMTGKDKDVIVLKIDKNGNHLWNHTYIDSRLQEGKHIVQVKDGYVIVGSSTQSTVDNTFVLVLKINFSGDMLWNRTYGTGNDYWGNKIAVIDDNRYAIVGGSYIDKKSSDVYYLEINSFGDMLFSDTYGKEGYEEGRDIIASSDKVFIVGQKGSTKKSIYLVELSRTLPTPTYSLTVNSEYGVVNGGGNYLDGARVTFSVSPTTVPVGEGVRYVFVEWRLDNGVRFSTSSTASLVINRNTAVNAVWQRQHYLNIRSEPGGTTTPSSNWHNAGAIVTIKATTDSNHAFRNWVGSGTGSYSGASDTASINMNGPITQTATWTNLYNVWVHSEIQSSGGGRYTEGDSVTIRTLPESGFFIQKLFLKWEGDIESSDNPLTITVNKDLNINAVYQTSYTYSIITGIAVLGTTFIVYYNKRSQEQRLSLKMKHQEKEQSIRDFIMKTDSTLHLDDVANMFGVPREVIKTMILDMLEKKTIKGYFKDSMYISEKALIKLLKEKIG